MQTFLPYADFFKSAESIDKQRCWKQVEESRQILTILECKLIGLIYITTQEKAEKVIGTQNLTSRVEDALYHKNGNPKLMAWINHPAVLMWEGHLNSLRVYFNTFLGVCKRVHKINTYYERLQFDIWTPIQCPWWIGNEDFHRAMRSRLIVKNEAFYLPKFPDDLGFNNGMYFWPVMDGSKTFRII